MDSIGNGRGFECDNGFGLLITGNRDWTDVSASATLRVHCAELAGLVLNYQGLQRFHAAVISHGRLRIVRNLYGETVLREIPIAVSEDQDFQLEASVADGVIRVRLDGAEVAAVRDDALTCGGAGLCVEDGYFRLAGDLRLSASQRSAPA